jgi:hypothetical protein
MTWRLGKLVYDKMVRGSGMLKIIAIVAFFSVSHVFCEQKFQNLDFFSKFSIISNDQLRDNIRDRIGGKFLVDYQLPFERIQKAVYFLSSSICDFNYNFHDILAEPIETVDRGNFSSIFSIIAPIHNYLHNKNEENRTALESALTGFIEDYETHAASLVEEMNKVFNNFDSDNIIILPEADDMVLESMWDQCMEIQTIAMCIADQEHLDLLKTELQELSDLMALCKEQFSLYDLLEKWADQGKILGFPELIQQNKTMLKEIEDLKKTVSFLTQLLIEKLQ